MAERKRKKTKEGNDPNEIKGIHQFIMGEKLGQGTFGKVRLATHVITGEKVAIKILEKDKIYQQEDKERVEKEIKILKMIRHNNLIQVYQVIQTPKLIYIVMEYSHGKDLFNHIVNSKKIKEDQAVDLFQQIIEGVDYCHKMKICHRDLKPENLLLEGEVLKLIDFGLSNTWNKSGKLKTACGSPSYAAPEMILGETEYYGSRVDVWSCGVILYVMVCGFLPFEDANQDKLYKKIIDGKYALPSFVSEPCKDLIRKIMQVDQEQRYTLAEIKLHPWYKSKTPKINEGLLSNQVVLPTDEEIMEDMKNKGFDLDDVRESIMMNKHNHHTTSYYLLVKSKIRQGLESESDLFSDRYIKYIKNPDNQLSRFDFDIKKAYEHRLKEAKEREIEKAEKEKNMEPDYTSFNFINSNNPSQNIESQIKDLDPKIQENNELIDNLKNLNNSAIGGDLIPTSSNPFEVSIEIRNSVREVAFGEGYPFKQAGKTVVITTRKEKGFFNQRNSIIKDRKLKEKKDKRLNRPRGKNNSTSFNCTDIECVKTTRDTALDKYDELKERVQRLKENLKYNVKTTFNKKVEENKEENKKTKTKRLSMDYALERKSQEKYIDKKAKYNQTTSDVKDDLKKQMNKCKRAKENLQVLMAQNAQAAKNAQTARSRLVSGRASPFTRTPNSGFRSPNNERENNFSLTGGTIGNSVQKKILSMMTSSTTKNTTAKNSPKNKEPKYLEDCMNYPLDLASSFFLSQSTIKDHVLGILNRKKMVILANTNNGVKAYLDKKEEKFRLSVQILKSSEVKNLNTVFFKRLDGDIASFKSICCSIIKNLNTIEEEVEEEAKMEELEHEEELNDKIESLENDIDSKRKDSFN